MLSSSGHQSSTRKGAEEVGSVLVLPLMWEALPPQNSCLLGGHNGQMIPTGPKECWEESRRHIRGGTSGEGLCPPHRHHCHHRALPESRGPGAGQEGSGRRQVASLFLPAHSAVLGGFLDRNGELDFSTFLTIMHMQIKQEDPKKEILLAMLMADKEKKGYIMASELRSKLMKLGEKLTHKEGNGLVPSFPTAGEDWGAGGRAPGWCGHCMSCMPQAAATRWQEG